MRMMRALAAFLTIGLAATAKGPGDVLRHVDPFIGTGGHGHTYPGAARPFGMVQLSPDTRNDGSWDSCAGYHHSDTSILGFSHTHLSGVGVPDYGDILFVPMMGAARLDPGDPGRPGSGYRSAFRRDTERAEPGYYTVRLDGPAVKAELTTTERVGFHRYTFERAGRAHLLIDLIHRDPVTEGYLRVVSDRRIEGFRRSKYWAGDQYHYFAAEFSRPVAGWKRFEKGQERPGSGRLEGTALQALATFDMRAGGAVEVKVATSAVSAEGAWKNLEAEGRGRGFEQVRRASREIWAESLARVQVEGGTEAERRIFYTALYHCLLTPNLYQDVDRRYRGMDGAIHRAAGFTNHTVFSLWDTFRALHPLLTILEPRRSGDFAATLADMGRLGGEIPMWELAANDTRCMIGYHGVSVIADAWAKGLKGFDPEVAYAQMKRTALLDKRGLKDYRTLGFVPSNKSSQSVSKTLEYAYDDWCIAQMAEGLGKAEDARMFRARSQSYRALFDARVGFMRPRMDTGAWVGSTFDPQAPGRDYTEGNAWQYSLFAPHDVPGLTELLGGRKALADYLDRLFATPMTLKLGEEDDISGLMGQYAHGNEPSHHLAYFWTFAGEPWKTQAMVRRILREQYADTPAGLNGNEDCGQMSAWYVMSALGFYPVCPGQPRYVLGSPLFDKVTLRLDGGKTFTIRARGNGADRPYIQRATLNGRPFRRTQLEHSALTGGGELNLEMGPEPARDWGLEEPPGFWTAPRVAPLPALGRGSDTFLDRCAVDLRCPDPAAEIRYTLDGREPGPASPRFERPFDVTATTTLKARAYAPGSEPSLVMTRLLTRSEALAPPAAPRPGLRYRAFEGIYRSVYDFAGDRPRAEGVVPRPGLEIRTRDDWYGLAFDGLIEVPEGGDYTFYVTAKDGCRLALDGAEQFESDGRKDRALPQQATLALKKGFHRIGLGFYKCSDHMELSVEWSGPGFERAAIPASAFFHLP